MAYVPLREPVRNFCLSVWDLLTCNTLCCSYAYRVTVRFVYGDGLPALGQTVTVTDEYNNDYSAAQPLDGTGRAVIEPLAFRGPYQVALNGWTNPEWRRITPAVTGNPLTDRHALINATTVCEIVCHDVEIINELGEPVLDRAVTLALTDGNRDVRTDATTGRIAGVAVRTRVTGVTVADVHEHFDGHTNAGVSATHFAHI